MTVEELVRSEFSRPIATPCPVCTAACHCGSGAHPRDCEFHGPLAVCLHAAELNYESTSYELQEAVELLKDALDRLIAFEGNQRDGTSRSIEKWLKENCYAGDLGEKHG